MAFNAALLNLQKTLTAMKVGDRQRQTRCARTRTGGNRKMKLTDIQSELLREKLIGDYQLHGVEPEPELIELPEAA